MALTNEQLDGINGPGSADMLANHRAEQAQIRDAAAAEKKRLLGGLASEDSGVVKVIDAQTATNQARTTAQNTIVGGKLAPDTVPEGSSAFVPGTTIPFGEGGVAVNPDATPRQPEVQVNSPVKPE